MQFNQAFKEYDTKANKELNKTQYKGGKLWTKVKGQTTGQTNH